MLRRRTPSCHLLSAAVGTLAFVWMVVLPWLLFVRRAPLQPHPSERETQRSSNVEDGSSAEGGDVDEGCSKGEVMAHNSDGANKTEKCIDALYQLGLDPQSAMHRLKCGRGPPPFVHQRNIALHLARDDNVDRVLVAFGPLLDADVKPHLYWFGALQSIVSTLTIMITGVFGGSHAAGLERSDVAHFLTSASTISVLVCFAAITITVRPYRNRSRDKWKFWGLLSSIFVASLSQATAFALAIRTENDTKAYSTFCTVLASAVVVSGACLFVILVVSYANALGFFKLLFNLFRELVLRVNDERRTRVLRVKEERASRQANEGTAVELPSIVGKFAANPRALESIAAQQINPLHAMHAAAAQHQAAENVAVDVYNPMHEMRAAASQQQTADDDVNGAADVLNPLFPESEDQEIKLSKGDQQRAAMMRELLVPGHHFATLGNSALLRAVADKEGGAMEQPLGHYDTRRAKRAQESANTFAHQRASAVPRGRTNQHKEHKASMMRESLEVSHPSATLGDEALLRLERRGNAARTQRRAERARKADKGTAHNFRGEFVANPRLLGKNIADQTNPLPETHAVAAQQHEPAPEDAAVDVHNPLTNVTGPNLTKHNEALRKRQPGATGILVVVVPYSS